MSAGGDLNFHTCSSLMIVSSFARLLYLIVILYNGFSKCMRWHQVNNLIVLKLLCFLAPTPQGRSRRKLRLGLEHRLSNSMKNTWDCHPLWGGTKEPILMI